MNRTKLKLKTYLDTCQFSSTKPRSYIANPPPPQRRVALGCRMAPRPDREGKDMGSFGALVCIAHTEMTQIDDLVS